MLPILDEKYYLAHAQELFDFVGNECAHLLGPEHRAYLDGFDSLAEGAQCLLVRFWSRKPRFLARRSLVYAEISDLDNASEALVKGGYICTIEPRHWREFSPTLTKAQLLNCLSNTKYKIKASTAKKELLSIVEECFDGSEPELNELHEQFLVRRQQSVIDYLLFLFFGDLSNRFQKFAMRDLGILKTRKSRAKQTARFVSKAEAESAFQLQLRRRELKLSPAANRERVADYLLNNSAVGIAAEQSRDRLLLNVGAEFAAQDPLRAIRLWRASDDPACTERWVRESYRSGDRDTLKKELESMRSSKLPAPSEIFVEDFYARKYLGKRTSVFTDMLRESANTLSIDEVYTNDVEDGVINYYRQQGLQAWFSENGHWRMMFAMCFWDLLFGQDQARVNEFESLPLPLRDNSFYSSKQGEIERCLRMFATPKLALAHYARVATQHYGVPNGIFRWRSNLLEMAQACIRHSPAGALAAQLTRMAQDYRHTRDGYPDLMVVENDRLRFEEIKAPGDVLRPNQLVSINRLRRAGFSVEVSQVQWAIDPNQSYAVVDIETTGGRRGLHSITEIAVVTMRNGEVVEEWFTLLNPQRPIPPMITRLTNITNQMVADAPLFQDIADELEAQLDGAIFVAHNVGFDYGFIKAAFDHINRPFRRPKFCTVQNSRKAFPGLASYSLSNLTAHFDIELRNAHRALSDARATAYLLQLIQEQRQSAG